jgi:hypothetical protein
MYNSFVPGLMAMLVDSRIASLIAARQKDLPDRYAVAIEDQGAALSVHRHVNISVGCRAEWNRAPRQ